MTEWFQLWLQGYLPAWLPGPWAEAGLSLMILLALAWAANWIAKQVVLRLLPRFLGRLPLAGESRDMQAFVARLSNVVPALVLWNGIGLVPHLPAATGRIVGKLAMVFIVLTIAMALSRLLSIANDLYERRPAAAGRPIKGYVQLVKMLMYGAAAILAFAVLLGQSPLLLLSGFGAMAAVLMLVFKDTLLSLVASVQIGATEMVRLGDWITMPQLDVDGDVVDIALHTVTVRNFDKTISTIPTYRFIADSFRNWREVSRRGIWRILRSLMIDQGSVRFLDAELLARLERIALLQDYLSGKRREVGAWNDAHGAAEPVDRRRLTNIGTFRAYMLAWLASQPHVVTSGESFVVRQLDPTANGLPLQIYAFVEGVSWAEYERIQSDIFDHLIAILPEFGLRLFQSPSGFDLAGFGLAGFDRAGFDRAGPEGGLSPAARPPRGEDAAREPAP